MTERPIWRGHLRLALVSCPVAMFTAKQERSNLHFHFINPETGNRVRMVTQDAQTGDELVRRDLVRGYEFKKDHYLLMSDEDFDSARIDSSGTLNVNKFVAAEAIDPIYYENSYYLVPDGDSGADVYAVLHEAIVKSKRVALSRVVIARRERAVVIVPMDKGMIAHTLFEQKDLHDPKTLFEQMPQLKPDPEMVDLATQLINRQSGKFDPADIEDRYEAKLREVIEAKLQGEGIAPEPADETRDNVIDLMAALKQSLQSGGAATKTRAKVSEPAAAKSGPKPAAAKKPAGRKRA